MSFFTKPIKFIEAIKRLSGLTLAKVALSTEQWRTVPDEIRNNAFFTAQVSSADVLSKLRGKLLEHLEQTKRQGAKRGTKLAVGGKAAFVKQMQPWMINNGFGDPLPKGTPRGERGAIPESKDLASRRRLELIYDVQVQKSQAYGSLKFSTAPEVIDAFPAWRFVRVGSVKEPRPDHRRHEGDVRLKSDDTYWTARNRDSIGGFGVPYGPWGFNSQMGVEDVPRGEAIQKGLLRANSKVSVKAPRFNAATRASIKNMDPKILDKLTKVLGDRAVIKGQDIELNNEQ